MWEPRFVGGAWWAGPPDPRSFMTGPYPTRALAQDCCDRINAAADLDRRKNAALDWAMRSGVPDAEIDAAVRTPGSVGLLDFEARMADTPLVVGGAIRG